MLQQGDVLLHRLAHALLGHQLPQQAHHLPIEHEGIGVVRVAAARREGLADRGKRASASGPKARSNGVGRMEEES